MGLASRRLNRFRAAAKEQRTGKKILLRYFARKLINDDFIKEFVVINGHLDPTMYVVSDAASGPGQRWLRVEEDGRSVFVAPADYAGGPIGWVYDRRFAQEQATEGMVYEQEKVFSFGDTP